MNRLALFDCDGTLIDSQHNICTAADACFAANGLESPDHHAVRRGVGLHVRDAMARLAPQWADATFIDKLAADFRVLREQVTEMSGRARVIFGGSFAKKRQKGMQFCARCAIIDAIMQ